MNFDYKAKLILALISLSLISLPALSETNNERFISAEELIPGEDGYGLTVLRGDSIIHFPVKYIGTINKVEPNRDLILIRLIGDPFEHTGIIAGMSGSPIYFRGRLLGALAYGWAFSKDPIAGVTSIKLMKKLIEEQSMDTSAVNGMIPLSAPLWVSGLPVDRTGAAWSRIDGLGFLSAPAGRTSGKQSLEPGSAVGVKLIDGDISMTAIGTVTYVEDSNVIAFGHPFLNRGISRLPMCGAIIETIMPSQQISFKLGSASENVGVMLRDGDPGISGMVGPTASMLPMTVELKTLWGEKKFSYTIAKDYVLTPQLIDIAWSASAQSGLFAKGAAGVEVAVRIFKDEKIIELRDRGVVSNSPLEVMPTLPVTLLFENPFQKFFPDRIEVEVTADQDLRRGKIYGVRALRGAVKPGETLPIEVLLRVYDEGERIERIDIPIPEGMNEGTIQVTVTGGRGLARSELAQPRTLQDLMKTLAEYEPSNMLVAQITSSSGLLTETDRGILPSLPPTVQRIQRGRTTKPNSIWQKESTDIPISGIGSVRVEVKE